MPFESDQKEYELINNFPSKTQTRYGRPDYKNDIQVKYRRIQLKDHLRRIRNINVTSQPMPETKMKKPKPLTKIDKTKISLTGLI